MPSPSKSNRKICLGSVSYLNAKPLIYGLEESADVHLALDVPSRLIDGLRDSRFDVALLPVIDYQRLDGLKVLTAGGIGCDGPTLTVRIFSRVPIRKISVLACDSDSHTSVALARVVLAESFDLHPELVQWDAHETNAAEARLLIGDKVVCEEPPGFEHQLDLGEAWKTLTNLPFVFAIWTALQDADLGGLPQQLELAKRAGLEHVDEIISRYATPRGWPTGLARQYLTQYLKYDIGQRQLEAIERFYILAGKYGMIESPPRGLRV